MYNFDVQHGLPTGFLLHSSSDFSTKYDKRRDCGKTHNKPFYQDVSYNRKEF